MEKVNWDEFNDKFWRPETEVTYRVIFSGPKVEVKTFGEDVPPKKVLTLGVISTQRVNLLGGPSDDPIQYIPPLEFSTSNRTFRDRVRPFLDRAYKNGQATITVFLRKAGERRGTKYDVFEPYETARQA